MTNPQKLLETWNVLKQTILKNKINAREEIKFALHELALTLSSEMNVNHSDYFKSALEKYKEEPPNEVKKVFELSNTRNPEIGNTKVLPFLLRRWYYQPITLWIKDRAKELGVSWEDSEPTKKED